MKSRYTHVAGEAALLDLHLKVPAMLDSLGQLKRANPRNMTDTVDPINDYTSLYKFSFVRDPLDR